jgi:hypothetical protein
VCSNADESCGQEGAAVLDVLREAAAGAPARSNAPCCIGTAREPAKRAHRCPCRAPRRATPAADARSEKVQAGPGVGECPAASSSTKHAAWAAAAAGPSQLHSTSTAWPAAAQHASQHGQQQQQQHSMLHIRPAAQPPHPPLDRSGRSCPRPSACPTACPHPAQQSCSLTARTAGTRQM